MGINEEYPYVLYHAKGCGKPAFRLKAVPEIGDLVDPSQAINLDGTKPRNGDKCVCCSCGRFMCVGMQEFNPEYVRKENS